MRTIRFGAGALALVVFSLLASSAAAAESTKPVQLALFNPVQIFPEKTSIAGVRIDLLYGVNQNVTGFDWGLVNHVRGDGFALQVGAVGYVEKNFQGWQDNLVSITKGEFTGLQSGGFNQAESANGVQFGWVNVTKHMHGLQLGFVNMTETMHGLQVGVANIIQKGKIPFLPLVNWSM